MHHSPSGSVVQSRPFWPKDRFSAVSFNSPDATTRVKQAGVNMQNPDRIALVEQLGTAGHQNFHGLNELAVSCFIRQSGRWVATCLMRQQTPQLVRVARFNDTFWFTDT